MTDGATTTSRQYTAAMIGLDLAGVFVGFVESAAGGEPYADVVVEPAGGDNIARKHVGAVHYEPIVIEVGRDLDESFFKWIGESMVGSSKPKDGKIRFFDYSGAERDLLEFSEASITRIELPPLSKLSTASARLAVTIAPTKTRRTQPAAGSVAPTAKKTSKLLARNFTVDITGCQSASQFVTTVNSIAVTCAPTVDISLITMTVAASHAADFRKWFEDFVLNGQNSNDNERSATINLCDPTQKNNLLTVGLEHVGIVRIAEANESSGSTTIQRVAIEMYCETMSLTVPPPAVKSDPSSDSGSGERSLTADGIADRLLASKFDLLTASTGSSWAGRDATLDELSAIAALDGQEWTTVTLPEDHTLLRALRAAGYVPQGPGPVVLDRDPQIERIISDAAAVYNKVLPIINERQSATAAGIISNLK
ncbi:MAG: hypothetical protein ACXWBO_20240 [Ilumatobacteraceae bacterium]